MEEIQRVAAVLAREDAVVFVGSGASMWSGLPSWDGLIAELSSELVSLGRRPEAVDRARASGDLLLAASYGVDQMTPQERKTFLRRVVDGSKAPSELHHALVQLGPTCFVTTNYDQLIERALQSHVDGRVDVITPASTLELPSIVQARSSHFVFKPHGDISNADTIVFSREDYRQLLGERRAVFEAMQMLFASRPVVFVGFGLRDPDFLQLRDLLFNTFQTNPSDHFAIMADVLEEERNYWRRHHGIDLVSYETVPGLAGTARHGALLDLLRSIKGAIGRQATQTTLESTVLTMARYARGLSVEHPASKPEDIPLGLFSSARDERGWRLENRLRGEAVTALARFEGNLLVEGAPGAGKSHILRRVVGTLASRMLTDCLTEERLTLQALRVPILIEMRDYRGDLATQVAEQLPAGVPLESVLAARAAVVVLDGLNEAPDVGGGDESLTSQLSDFLQRAAGNTVLMTTRSAAPVRDLDVEIASLDAVNESAVVSRLASRGMRADEVSPATLDLLKRPLFFRAWVDGELDLTTLTSVHGIYLQVLGRLDRAASMRFGCTVSVASALGEVAAKMIDLGGLTAERITIVTSLKTGLPVSIDPEDFYTFIIEQQLLVPTSTRRLAFYHHSVTEYIAAHYLARRISEDKDAVLEFLGRRDWDHALLLTLGFLPSEVAIDVHKLIMQVDPGMGLRGLHFIDHDQEQWLQRSLAVLPNILGAAEPYRWSLSLEGLPFHASHIPELKSLAELRNHLGGEALAVLASLEPSFLAVAVDSLASGTSGYNFSTELARRLAPRADRAFALRLFERLDNRPITREQEAGLLAGYSSDDEHDLVAVVAACEEVLDRIDDEVLIELIGGTNSVLARVVGGSALRHRRTSPSIDFIRAEIENGDGYAVVVHNFQLRFGEPEGQELPLPSANLIKKLTSFIASRRIGKWSLEILKLLAEHESRIADLLREETGDGLGRALLLYAVGDEDGFKRELLSLASSATDWQSQPVWALGGVTKWDPEVVMALLRTRDDLLARVVLESLQSEDEYRLSDDITDVASWIDWLRDLAKHDPFLSYLLGRFLARNTTANTRAALIGWFATTPDDRYVMSEYVLQNMEDLRLDDFDAPTVEWLVSRASLPAPQWDPPLIARIATEELTERRLLPLFVAADGASKPALASVLLEIGRRLDRRYISLDGTIVLSDHHDTGDHPATHTTARAIDTG